MSNPGTDDMAANWLSDKAHRDYLVRDAHQALNFFDASVRPDGGFYTLDLNGKPLPSDVQELHTTTRLIHSYVLSQMAGREDRAGIIDRGMDYLWNKHRDDKHGGYVWSLNADGVEDGVKLAYGHVFTLLAGASAKLAGHADADRLLTDATEVLDRHYWDESRGLFRDEFTRDWQPFSEYRGMNANMHGVEALLTAFEATGESEYLRRAGRILDFFITQQAANNNWRIPEHYNDKWEPDLHYEGNPMFRPAGTTPGHSFELARLLLQYWDLTGRPETEAPAQARNLVERALSDAWDENRGGFAYTMDFDGTVGKPARYWWPVTEAIGALAALIKRDPRKSDENWYRRLWKFADQRLIDHVHGGWFPELGADDLPDQNQFAGKPDIYHALQADLLPLTPGLSRAAEALRDMKPLG